METVAMSLPLISMNQAKISPSHKEGFRPMFDQIWRCDSKLLSCPVACGMIPVAAQGVYGQWGPVVPGIPEKSLG